MTQSRLYLFIENFVHLRVNVKEGHFEHGLSPWTRHTRKALLKYFILKGQSHEKVFEFFTWDGSFSLN
jgi:hypothetical protein